MDRQLRNIALITLLLAALTIIAVVSPETPPPTIATVVDSRTAMLGHLP